MKTTRIKCLALILVVIWANIMTIGNSGVMAAEQQSVLFGDVTLSKNCSLTLNTLDEAVVDLHDFYQNIHTIFKNQSKKQTAYLEVQPFNDKVKISPGMEQAKDYPVIFPSVLVIKNITHEANTKVLCEIKAIQN